MFPIIGPVLGFALSEVLPNVRLDRIEYLFRYLDNRIGKLELETALESQLRLDTFEEGIWQTARAISEERKLHIAKLVLGGLVKEEDDAIRSRNFLRILNLLDDRQIILLAGYLPSLRPVVGNDEAEKFYKLHGEIIRPEMNIEDFFDVKGREKTSKMMGLNASMLGQLASLGLLDIVESIDNIGKSSTKIKYNITDFGEEFLIQVGADADG